MPVRLQKSIRLVTFITSTFLKMRTLMTLVFLCYSFLGIAQVVKIEKRDGTYITSSISAVGGAELYTKSGAYKFTEMKTVTFKESMPSDESLYRKLRAAGVNVDFGDFESATFQPSIFLEHAKGWGGVIVNNANINDSTDLKYIELIGYNIGVFKKSVVIIIDYGQKMKVGESQTITASNGKSMKFQGVVDALNFMYNNGWEFVMPYLVNDGMGGSVYHYILKRKERQN